LACYRYQQVANETFNRTRERWGLAEAFALARSLLCLPLLDLLADSSNQRTAVVGDSVSRQRRILRIISSRPTASDNVAVTFERRTAVAGHSVSVSV
jgi:hypothetical protein